MNILPPHYHFFKEHHLNSVLSKIDIGQQYLHIPVNASSWGKTVFSSLGFIQDTLNCDFSTIIFFRDPIDRWLSGLATWLTCRLPQHTPITDIRGNTAVLDILFDTVRQDPHTETQSFFVQHVDWNRARCFYMDAAFNQYFQDYISTSFNKNISGFPRQHETTLEGGKLIPKTYFRQALESNPKYLSRVLEYFEPDRQLLKKLDFVNTKQINMQYYDI